MIEIIPGILEKEFGEIEKKLRMVAGHADWVQIDFADNTLVPNATFLDFSRFPLSPLSPQFPFLEAHLMVANPEKYIKSAADAGFSRIIAHVEAHDPRLFLDQVKYEHVEAGIAIDAHTPLEEAEPFVEEVDFVLVMTAEAGSSSTPFLPECVEKIKAIHANFPDLPIEAEGGITEGGIPLLSDAGATRIIV